MRLQRSLVTVLLALVGLILVAAPAAAYTIYLKDGSRLVATEKYQIKGELALIRLQNGTVTTIKASEIDVARTEAANKSNLGTAVILEGAQFRDTPAPPPKGPVELSDLIKERRVGPRLLPEVKRIEPSKEPSPNMAKTAAGYLDFTTVAHNPLPVETTAEIQRVFYEHGLRELSIWRGTKPDRALVEVSVTSEATTFKAIAVAAKLLDGFRQQHRSDVSAVELSLVATQGGRAGQFLLTSEQAADLLANRLEISSFYVQNLQF